MVANLSGFSLGIVVVAVLLVDSVRMISSPVF